MLRRASYSFAQMRVAPVELAVPGGRIKLLRTLMLRLIWRRAAALAFPLTLAVCLPPMAVIAFNLRAQSTAAAPQSGAANSTDSAAAKAAARKKAFEADEKRLEQDGSSHVDNASGSATLFVSPATVNMVAGQVAGFSAFDDKGHDVTSQAEWSLSNRHVVQFEKGGAGKPYVVAKGPGEVTVRARIDNRESSCDVTVYDGKTLPAGTPRWVAAKIPGFTAKQVAPAARSGGNQQPTQAPSTR
jgi:hypothetical protein